MQIIAKVLDYEIRQSDIDRECSKFHENDPIRAASIALEHLIDRCLLLGKAIQSGIEISNREYDDAIIELIDSEAPFGLTSSEVQALTGNEIENLLRRNLIIKKYVKTLYPEDLPITAERLKELYNENTKIFSSPEMVRCSHILFSGDDPLTQSKAQEVRDAIQNEEDFTNYCKSCSDCPSNQSGGDLGWIARGKLTHAMDEVAFGLSVGEISHAFKSPFGWHILMITDRKPSLVIPFAEIENSLQASITQLEREYLLSKHLAELREEYAPYIIIETDLSVQI